MYMIYNKHVYLGTKTMSDFHEYEYKFRLKYYNKKNKKKCK